MESTWKPILISVIVAVLTKWAVKLLNWAWFRPRKLEKLLRNQGLDGTPYRPLLGDLKDLVAITKDEQARTIGLFDDLLPHILPYYQQIISKYGQNSFFWLGPYPRLNIMDPELIKEILKRPDLYEKGLKGAAKSLSSGLTALDGEEWANRRKIINTAFHIDKLKKMVPAIGLSCSSMMRKWEVAVSTNNEGRCEIDVWPYLEELTGDVISRTAFGSSHEQGRRIFQLLREKVKLNLQILPFFVIPGWSYLPTKTNRKVRAISNEMKSILRAMIDKRHKAMERGEATPRDDLLGILLESNSRFIQEYGHKDKGMSIDDVIKECELFYLAGSETTSSLLLWTMVLLGKHPEWQTQAREEVARVFRDTQPNFDGLNQLKIVSMILQEVLRLYTPVPTLARLTKETTKLGSLTIPGGVFLTLLIGAPHYDPKYWGDDAKEFKPQRFSTAGNTAKLQSSFIPFSSGPRVCIGQNLAMIEAKMALAMILQHFSFELSPSYLHAPATLVTTTPKHGAPLILRKNGAVSVS